MNIWREHILYLKDNPEGYWFKRKLYGIGWTPARKEGWLVLGAYVVFVLAVVYFHETETYSNFLEPKLAVGLFVTVTILLLVTSWRTGESLKWQWGAKGKYERE